MMKTVNTQSNECLINKEQGFQCLKSLLFASVFALTACGGGEGGGNTTNVDANTTPNQAPLSTERDRVTRLNAATTWMYQIQNLNDPGAAEYLAATDYPMLVIEPGNNFDDDTGRYETAKILTKLRTAPDDSERLILAYIDVGEAEDYRDYWQDNWVAPTETTVGSPDFLITIDPDGWSGNYPVAYWRPEWQALWLGDDGIISKLAKLGFDGIYLDWIEGYDDEKVRAFAISDGVADPDEAMVAFIEKLRAAGQAVSRDFLVVAQNAPYLIDYDIENNTNRYANAIDALAVEDTWYYGDGDAEWDAVDLTQEAAAGDRTGDERQQGDFSTPKRLEKYADYQDRGIPVFSVDYCISNETARTAYTEARAAGLRPLVTRVSLSQVTVTPPEDF